MVSYAIELHLIRLMQTAGSNIVDTQGSMCANLLLYAEVVLIVVGAIQSSTRERIHANCEQTGWRTRCEACARSPLPK